MSSRAVGVSDDDIKEVERQLKEICESSTKLFICDGQFWDYSVFDGMMLSDGHLQKGKRSRNARFRLSCKHAEFANTFKMHAGNFNWSDISIRNVFDKRTNKTHISCRLDSKVDERLTEQHSRWYPNGKKIVPRDISLDRSTLMWWYLGDGFLTRKKSRPNYRRIGLATEGFTDDDIEFLRSKLIELLGDDSIYIEGREIMIAKKALCNFIKIVGLKSPVSCYQYKFDFGPYVNENYWKKSFEDRPLNHINEYRKKHKVRELNFKSKEEINHE